ncbi:hypothetical protein WICPIJ_009164 [Wickerhamomyces pijperi]|uniref:Uncharacterized protein n=1 Tax=Wickerhamomyces pijperi TaxID=599730 RepID=A0A9P8TEV1_WICPI|nr:hypothetical protein WICPIJ_009164 [Wickerhamomyces pijperi]
MLNSISKIHVARQVIAKRFLTSSSNISKLIQSADIEGVKDVLSHPSFVQAGEQQQQQQQDTGSKVSKLVQDIYDSQKFNNEQLIDLHNFVLSKFLNHDRSLSMVHQNHINQLQGSVTLPALTEIIRFNSGRLHTSWELFDKYYQSLNLGNQDPQSLDKLLTTLLGKLVNGEDNSMFEEEEEVEQLSDADLVRAVFVYKNLSQPQENIRSLLFNRALELKDHKLAQIIGVESLESLGSIKSSNAKDELLAYLILTNTKPELKSGDVLSNLLLKINATDLTFDHSAESSLISDLTKLNLRYPAISINTSIADISTDLENLLADLSTVVVGSEQSTIATRVNSLKALGFNSADISDANLWEFYKEITSDVKNSTEISELKDTLLQSLLYRYFSNPTSESLNQIEQLLTESIKSLQSRILLNYKSSNMESALDLYNSQISQLSKQPNNEGYSPASQVTETLVISYLLNGDREFAHLIHDGGIMNGIFVTDKSKEKVKKEFKKYGDVFGEEDQDKITLLVKEWETEYIKSI